MNIILDPLFIFGFGLGTNGAAYATWLSQATVFAIFIYQLRFRKDALLGGFPFFSRLKKKYTAYSEIRSARSYPEHVICVCQHVPLPHRLRTGRTHRTDDLHHRRTNRSYHLNTSKASPPHLAPLLHRISLPDE